MRPTVLLFDIDGTLVTTGGAGRRALERTFEVVYGREDVYAGFRFDGMTDRAIVRGGLQAIGEDDSESVIDGILSRYVAVLEEEIEKVDPARYYLHRGMVEVLDAAAERPHVAVGLGTGNIKEGARVKLQRVGIHDRFSFGGFGCDAESRPELIRIGAERGARKLGAPLEDCRVVIIGDTPKDVAAALAMNAQCVGVGTGAFKPEELIAVGAHHAFGCLGDEGALRAVLGD